MNFERTIPIIRILDVAKAREFYLDWLGFQVDFEHRFDDNAPLYMGISRGSVQLHLSEHYGDGIPGGTSVMIRMTGLREYHAEVSAKQYKYYRPGIMEQEWGLDEMKVLDPFGNRLTFAEARQEAGS